MKQYAQFYKKKSTHKVKNKKPSNSPSTLAIRVMFWQNTKQESLQLPKTGGQASFTLNLTPSKMSSVALDHHLLADSNAFLSFLLFFFFSKSRNLLKKSQKLTAVAEQKPTVSAVTLSHQAAVGSYLVCVLPSEGLEFYQRRGLSSEVLLALLGI